MDEQPAGAVSPPETPKRGEGRRSPGITVPVLLILAGLLLLLNTTHLIQGNWERLWMLWPALLILLGLDLLLGRVPAGIKLLAALLMLALLCAAGILLVTTSPAESAHVVLGPENCPRTGAARGDIRLEMGIGQIRLSEARGDRPALAEGEVWGGRAETGLCRVEGATAYLEVAQGDWFEATWSGEWGGRWELGLARNLPLSLSLSIGIGEGEADLGRLQVERAKMDVGVGSLRVVLPEENRPARVQMRAGVGAVHLTVPAALPVRIRAHAGLGRATVDETFPEVDGEYRSSSCTGETRCVEIDLNVGLGDITVVGR
ncbi:MAG: LiaI-LiaF-like domain-containing protein [Chloroflexia bacterium]